METIPPSFLYDIIYALMATDGREKLLFGSTQPLAHEAFAQSMISEEFPELWFELPLVGEPWFDLHVLASHESMGRRVRQQAPGFDYSPIYSWFAEAEGVRQLALSWDVGSSGATAPAVQLLVRTGDPRPTCDFLEVAGRPDAREAYLAFRKRLPRGWFACYTGVFPNRPSTVLRVECIPNPELQRRYAQDGELLAEHLGQVGLSEPGDTVVSRCQALAGMPFQFELQFDVDENGQARSTLAASLRFQPPPGSKTCGCYGTDGAARTLMEQVVSWGLADDRWQPLAATAYCKHIKLGDSQKQLYAFPAFVKLRWRDGAPLDAKAYLIAGATPI